MVAARVVTVTAAISINDVTSLWQPAIETRSGEKGDHAALMYHARRLPEAEASLRQGILSPREQRNLALVLLGATRLSEAEAHCRLALAAEPTSARAHGLLGRILSFGGGAHIRSSPRDGEALIYLKNAVGLAESKTPATWTLEIQQYFEDAIRYFVFAGRADKAFLMADRQAARMRAVSAINTPPAAAMAARVALSLLGKRPERALQLLEESLDVTLEEWAGAWTSVSFGPLDHWDDKCIMAADTRSISGVPDTFVLPQQIYDFEKHREEGLWILKPCWGAAGAGILVLGAADELPTDVRALAQGIASPRSRYIAQRYIQHPLLINGRKCDFRLYMLTTVGARFWLYKEGLVRCSRKQYDLDSRDHGVVTTANQIIFRASELADWKRWLALIRSSLLKLWRRFFVYGTAALGHPDQQREAWKVYGLDVIIDRWNGIHLVELNFDPDMGAWRLEVIGAFLPCMQRLLGSFDAGSEAHCLESQFLLLYGNSSRESNA